MPDSKTFRCVVPVDIAVKEMNHDQHWKTFLVTRLRFWWLPALLLWSVAGSHPHRQDDKCYQGQHSVCVQHGYNRAPAGSHRRRSLRGRSTRNTDNWSRVYHCFDWTTEADVQRPPGFHRYGDKYFLAKIWDGQSDTVIALPNRRRRQAASRTSWQTQRQREIVAIIAVPLRDSG
jgi:hypothetical protein